MYVYNRIADGRQRLESGAVACCVFCGNGLASIGWVALTEEAHRSLFQPGYKVNFEVGQASTGGGWTDPWYRRKRLAVYNYCKRLEYIWSHGKTSVRTAVRTDNKASLKLHANFSPIIKVRGRDLKILWHRSWTEIPVNQEISRVLR